MHKIGQSPLQDSSVPVKISLRAALKPLFAYVKPYRLKVAMAAVAILFTSGSVLGMGMALRYLVDEGMQSGDTRMLNHAFILMLGVIGLLAVATYARYSLVAWLGERVVADIRRATYAKLVAMDMEFFETTRTGELLSRLTTDTSLLQTVIGSTVSIALRNTLLLLGGLSLLLMTSSRLTLYVLGMLPVVVAPILILGRQVRGLSKAAQGKVADLNAHAEEMLNAIRLVQAMTLEEQENARFQAAAEDALSTALSRIRVRALLVALVISLVFGAVVTVLWIGGHDVVSKTITSGQLSAFVFYAVVVAGAVAALSEVGGELQRAAGAAERLSELLKLTPAIAERADARPLPPPLAGACAVEFSAVGFHYASRADKHAVEDISFRIGHGEAVALVGPSGAGKTTLFQLLLRFYDPQSGTIFFEGEDIRNVGLRELRGAIGLVPQDPVMFSANAWENIRAGKPDASDAEVLKAAEAAYALEFLQALPEGLDTHLGVKGVRLSGGQKQRIAIARAVIRNPRLLLLDEATSALDAQSEHYVQRALSELMRGRSTLIIAHRLSTVMNADRILLMEDGKLQASGTHAELLRGSALYAKLAALHWQGQNA